MKKQKKYLIIGGVVLSLLVIMGMGYKAVGGSHGPRLRGCHGFHGDGAADFMLWRMDRYAKDLDLDEAQMKQYEEIKAQVKANIRAAMERKESFHEMVHNEMGKENPDLNALAVEVKKRLETVPEVIAENIDLFLKLYNGLKPEQQAQLIQMFRDRMY